MSARRLSAAALAAAALWALLALPEAVKDGVRAGLDICARSLVPSLFPFMVLSSAASGLGLTQTLAAKLGGVMRGLFRLPDSAASALLAGLLGGYPLGAAAVSDSCRRGELSAAEAERALAFCNNSGPGFLVGAAGLGVFGSVRAGLALYAAHALAALTAGLVMRGVSRPGARPLPRPGADRRGVLVRAVTSSARNMLNVCAFVALFSALTASLEACGALELVSGWLARCFSIEPAAARALSAGFFELGGGVGALAGCAPTRANFALAALMLGWGGLSVHLQTAAVLPEDIKTARHTAGRLLSALFGAIYAALLYGAAGL